jgi:hypothetical protein
MILTSTILFILFPGAFIDPSIWPVKEALSVHSVFLEIALVNLSLAGNGPSVAIAKPIFKPAFVDGVTFFENFEAFAVGAPIHCDYFPSVIGSALALLKV